MTSEKKVENPLRFALLIRVSTEKQARRGESLRTQESQLTDAVRELGGIVSKRYSGQEHATAGSERQLYERLLQDAARPVKPFDAVMVADQSRWSRDNGASEAGLEQLRDNGIKFYVLTQVHDLHHDDARLFLAVQSTINGYQARVQTRKALENRIHRANRGHHATGTLPYGRLFDKATGKWSVDPNAQSRMTEIANSYVGGKSLARLAAEYGINESTLHDRLQKCSPVLPVRFRSENLGIDESCTIEIPALLDAELIRAVRLKAEANKTFSHGYLKHEYLLSRMVFCEHCHSAFSGMFSNGQKYYRHPPKDARGCPFKGNVRGDDLESAVMHHLFECFGNPVAVQAAIEAATPDSSKIDEYRDQETRLSAEVEQIKKATNKILGLIAKNSITDDDAEGPLNDLKTRKLQIEDSLQSLRSSLQDTLNPKKIKSISAAVTRDFIGGRPLISAKKTARIECANSNFDKMKWDEKRALVEMIFSGRTPEGHRMGVSVSTHDENRRIWQFSIAGNFIQTEGFAPMTESQFESRFTFGISEGQKDLLKKLSVERRSGRSGPILPQRYFRPDRSRHHAGE